LKVLYLNNNPLSITEIDKALQSLPQIESLSLGDLGLRTLPASVLRLKNLKTLNLSNTDEKKKNPNTLSPAEQEKIRKLLPACTLSF
jgi:Leucine-rich repeat (LRR) protein